MAEYVKRSDVINKLDSIALEYLNDHSFQCDFAAGVTVLNKEAVEEIPAADVVEVVRCKDCRGWLKSGICRKTNGICAADDYCSKAERK